MILTVPFPMEQKCGFDVCRMLPIDAHVPGHKIQVDKPPVAAQEASAITAGLRLAVPAIAALVLPDPHRRRKILSGEQPPPPPSPQANNISGLTTWSPQSRLCMGCA